MDDVHSTAETRLLYTEQLLLEARAFEQARLQLAPARGERPLAAAPPAAVRRPLRALAAAALCHALEETWDAQAVALVNQAERHWATVAHDLSFAMAVAKEEFSLGELEHAIGPWDTAARVQQMAWEPGCGPGRAGMLLTELLVARARSELITLSQARPLPLLLLLKTCPARVHAHARPLPHLLAAEPRLPPLARACTSRTATAATTTEGSDHRSQHTLPHNLVSNTAELLLSTLGPKRACPHSLVHVTRTLFAEPRQEMRGSLADRMRCSRQLELLACARHSTCRGGCRRRRAEQCSPPFLCCIRWLYELAM